MATEGYEVRHINRSTWVTPPYYGELSAIGAGAFGTVCSAVDGRTGQPVALKKLQRPFQSKVHAQRAYREIKLLRFMNHENVIGMLDVFYSQAPGVDSLDVYISTELMGSDLHSIISTQTISDEHIQFLTYQILRALVYVHSAGIVHRDLKPSNIAISADCDLKILDFGLARAQAVDGSMTGYVATRWYRAPEVMLKWGHYSSAMDMWSVGCIIAELLIGQPLFRGHDNVEQLNRIVALLGKPSAEFISSIETTHAQEYVRSLAEVPRHPFLTYFPNVNPQAVDLLERLLTFETHARLTALDAIRHPYLAKYHDPDDEPLAPVPFDESFEHLDLEMEGWRDMVIREIDDYKMQSAIAAAAEPVVVG